MPRADSQYAPLTTEPANMAKNRKMRKTIF